MSAVVDVPPLNEYQPTIARIPSPKRPMISLARPITSTLNPTVASNDGTFNAGEAAFLVSNGMSRSSLEEAEETTPSTPAPELVAVSTALLSNLKTTTAYQMFGIEESSADKEGDAASRHAALMQDRMPRELLRVDSARGLITMALQCLHSWANRAHAHHGMAVEMVGSMRALVSMKWTPGTRSCTPLLLVLASTFEMLVSFAGPGWLQAFLDPGSDKLFATQLRKVWKFFEPTHGGLGLDCASLLPDPRVDKRVAPVREYTISILKVLEGASSASSPSKRPISPIRLTPRATRQRADFITRLCIIFTPAPDTAAAACQCKPSDMEREVEIVLRERRELRHLFSLLVKDMGLQRKQPRAATAELDQLLGRLEDVFRNQVC